MTQLDNSLVARMDVADNGDVTLRPTELHEGDVVGTVLHLIPLGTDDPNDATHTLEANADGSWTVTAAEMEYVGAERWTGGWQVPLGAFAVDKDGARVPVAVTTT